MTEYLLTAHFMALGLMSPTGLVISLLTYVVIPLVLNDGLGSPHRWF